MAESISDMLREMGEHETAEFVDSHKACHDAIAQQAKEIADLKAQVDYATTAINTERARVADLEAQVGVLIDQVIECQEALYTVNSKVWNKPRTKDWWKRRAEQQTAGGATNLIDTELDVEPTEPVPPFPDDCIQGVSYGVDMTGTTWPDEIEKGGE